MHEEQILPLQTLQCTKAITYAPLPLGFYFDGLHRTIT